MSKKKNLIFSLFFLFVSTANISSFAVEHKKVSENQKNTVSKAVEKWLNGRYQVDSVKKTPMLGVLEVRIGNQLIYVDAKANYVLIEGRMIDLKTGEDLTASRLEKIFTIDFSVLPLDIAIKTQTGTNVNKGRTIAVFEDPFCSYCKKFRMTLEEIDGLTIYTFLLPIISEKSAEISKKIWCSEDQGKAWTDFMARDTSPNEILNDCTFPENELLDLAKKLGINATPTSYLISGKRIPGAVSKELLEKEFGQISVLD
ncbi:MAG: hypothetical protein CBD16_08970 [Betaproteobacteria bacterium TMED156]|nr:MAG: hypothetical protein CBD16_08970 [Betaproteobacteria bacterium TMED156]